MIESCFELNKNKGDNTMKQINGGVTAAQGFSATGLAVGIKKKSEKKDMALVYSEKPCKVAGTFTKNIVKAACVKYDMDVVENSPFVQAVVVNSGIANACTGKQGYEYCGATAKAASESLNIPENAVLVASTGVIGAQLPIDRIAEGVKLMTPLLGTSVEDGTLAAEAIMTTDTRSKQIAYQLEIGGKTVTVGGMCKGSGMIHPNMCTMLAFVTTDINISKEMLTKAVKANVEDTFNMVSVDGDTSTNDTMLVMANGMAGNEEITEENEDFKKFSDALFAVNSYLAKQMAGDGEGATALFEVKVVGAESKEQAVTIAKSVVSSSLVKTAIAGHDANWGRICCAMGYSGAQFDPEKVDLYFISQAGELKIVENSVSTGYSEEKATEILSQPEITALIDIKMGDAEATAWGCDLTHEYISINADYRS